LTRGDVEVVRASIDAFNLRDTSVLLELVHPDVEWVPLRAVLYGDVYRGHDGIERFIADMDGDIEQMQVRVDDLFEVGENVVIYGSIVGKGRAGGMELDLPIGWVIRVLDGRVCYLRAYPERGDALKAAEDARSGVEQPLGPPARALDS
jgi:ketosteroid isomerase-like protein